MLPKTKDVVKYDHVFQAGDMGIGFLGHPDPQIPHGIRFIRGNHDNPEECKNHPRYLGDFGIFPLSNGDEMFFLGGAHSIDGPPYRTAGIDWWQDEELLPSQFEQAYDLYKDHKPNIVMTHDAPSFVANFCVELAREKSIFLRSLPPFTPRITNIWLEKMFEFHQPKIWYHGHHHVNHVKTINGCEFICQQPGGVFEYEVPS